MEFDWPYTYKARQHYHNKVLPGIPKARDQEEDQETIGEESKRTMGKEVEKHGQR